MKAYTISQLAKMAGVSVRTLHHYDQIGLLRPAGRSAAGYRLYAEPDLLRLQQVLFFKELDMPLDEVRRTVPKSRGAPAGALGETCAAHLAIWVRRSRVRPGGGPGAAPAIAGEADGAADAPPPRHRSHDQETDGG
jgi:DNA-binding transcriptional MerR regulator